jgi:hypothetical protein
MRYKGVVFAIDGIKYEGGSQGLTVLHCILQYYNAISDLIFDNRDYVHTALAFKMTCDDILKFAHFM